MTKKTLSLIHVARGLTLMSKLDGEDGQLEMVATYLAPASTLIKSKRDREAMEPLIAQAAELSATEAAEVLADFLLQFKGYNDTLRASFPKMPTPPVPPVDTFSLEPLVTTTPDGC